MLQFVQCWLHNKFLRLLSISVQYVVIFLVSLAKKRNSDNKTYPTSYFDCVNILGNIFNIPFI